VPGNNIGTILFSPGQCAANIGNLESTATNQFPTSTKCDIQCPLSESYQNTNLNDMSVYFQCIGDLLFIYSPFTGVAPGTSYTGSFWFDYDASNILAVSPSIQVYYTNPIPTCESTQAYNDFCLDTSRNYNPQSCYFITGCNAGPLPRQISVLPNTVLSFFIAGSTCETTNPHSCYPPQFWHCSDFKLNPESNLNGKCCQFSNSDSMACGCNPDYSIEKKKLRKRPRKQLLSRILC